MMSVNFEHPVNLAAERRLWSLFGEPVATDRATFLYNRGIDVHGDDLKKIANTAGQPIKLEANQPGDIKKMIDGARYILTGKGWRRIHE
jgi:hypothetical protein